MAAAPDPSPPARPAQARRRSVRRPGPLRRTVLVLGAVSLGAAAAISGGLASQMSQGGDPGLSGKAGTQADVAPDQPPAAPAQPVDPTPVVTRAS